MFGKKADPSIERRLKAISSAKPLEFQRKSRMVERKDQRHVVFKFGTIHLYNKDQMRCVVKNVSHGGAMVVLDGAIQLPEHFIFEIDGFKRAAKARLAWQRGNEVGVQYLDG